MVWKRHPVPGRTVVDCHAKDRGEAMLRFVLSDLDHQASLEVPYWYTPPVSAEFLPDTNIDGLGKYHMAGPWGLGGGTEWPDRWMVKS